MTALMPLPKRVPFWLSPERRRSALLTVALHLAAGLGFMLVPEEKIVNLEPGSFAPTGVADAPLEVISIDLNAPLPTAPIIRSSQSSSSLPNTLSRPSSSTVPQPRTAQTRVGPKKTAVARTNPTQAVRTAPTPPQEAPLSVQQTAAAPVQQQPAQQITPTVSGPPSSLRVTPVPLIPGRPITIAPAAPSALPRVDSSTPLPTIRPPGSDVSQVIPAPTLPSTASTAPTAPKMPSSSTETARAGGAGTSSSAPTPGLEGARPTTATSSTTTSSAESGSAARIPFNRSSTEESRVTGSSSAATAEESRPLFSFPRLPSQSESRTGAGQTSTAGGAEGGNLSRTGVGAQAEEARGGGVGGVSSAEAASTGSRATSTPGSEARSNPNDMATKTAAEGTRVGLDTLGRPTESGEVRAGGQSVGARGGEAESGRPGNGSSAATGSENAAARTASGGPSSSGDETAGVRGAGTPVAGSETAGESSRSGSSAAGGTAGSAAVGEAARGSSGSAGSASAGQGEAGRGTGASGTGTASGTTAGESARGAGGNGAGTGTGSSAGDGSAEAGRGTGAAGAGSGAGEARRGTGAASGEGSSGTGTAGTGSGAGEVGRGTGAGSSSGSASGTGEAARGSGGPEAGAAGAGGTAEAGRGTGSGTQAGTEAVGGSRGPGTGPAGGSSEAGGTEAGRAGAGLTTSTGEAGRTKGLGSDDGGTRACFVIVNVQGLSHRLASSMSPAILNESGTQIWPDRSAVQGVGTSLVNDAGIASFYSSRGQLKLEAQAKVSEFNASDVLKAGPKAFAYEYVQVPDAIGKQILAAARGCRMNFIY